MNKKGMSSWIWILIVLVIIALGIGIYLYASGGISGIGGASSIPQPPALPSG